MNITGADIFGILKNEVTIEDVVKIMLEKHPEATEEAVIKAVTQFADKLKLEGIIV